MAGTLRLAYELDHSLRLDKYLAGLKLPELYSRTFVERLIRSGKVSVNGYSVKKSYILETGDRVKIEVPDPLPVEITPQDIRIDVLFEDDWLAVVNKPAGLVVHPGWGNPDGTLANALVFRYGRNLSSQTPERRPGIVHRLDKGTSGLIIVAKSDLAQSRLSDLFARRQVKKTYLAVTKGVPDPLEGRLESHIGRDTAHPGRMKISASGRLAVTTYDVVRCFEGFALVRAGLETGRTHQVRVHMASLHSPILGDPVYNSLSRTLAGLPNHRRKLVTDLLEHHLLRQALHAWKLEFRHPFTNRILSLTASLPSDLIHTLEWLKHNFNIDNESSEEILFDG